MARFAVLFLLVACSKEPKPAVASKPVLIDAAVDVMIIEQAAVAATTPMALQEKCPVGDMTNVAVYGFLEREIDEANKRDEGKRSTKELLEYEAKLQKQPDMKPPSASIIEREMSHVLTTLCAGTRGCKAIGLYDESGLAIALSYYNEVIAPLGFVDPELKKLLDSPEGTIVVRDGETYVINSIKRGLALCIVAP